MTFNRNNRMGKIAGLIAGSLLAASTSHASIVFDPDGAGGFVAPIPDVQEFDWGVGNVVAKHALVSPGGPLLPVGSSFTTYYQARLQGFQLTTGTSGGTGLPFGHEITVVAGFRQEITSLSPDGSDASFEIIDHTDNFVRVYYHTPSNSNISNGTGFDDGTLILQATPVLGTSSIDSSLATTNKGRLNVVAEVDWVHEDFFPMLSDSMIVNLINVGTIQNLGSVNQGTQFDTEDDGTVTYSTDDNDFAFRSDVNSRVELTDVPEPGSAVMLAAGLTLLGWRNRRQAA